MRIEDFDTDERVFVVAEIGNDHEGDFALAQEMEGRPGAVGRGCAYTSEAKRP